jgi:hypothetical protein
VSGVGVAGYAAKRSGAWPGGGGVGGGIGSGRFREAVKAFAGPDEAVLLAGQSFEGCGVLVEGIDLRLKPFEFAAGGIEANEFGVEFSPHPAQVEPTVSSAEDGEVGGAGEERGADQVADLQNASLPGNSAESPRSEQMRRSWLYLATRSERQALPVLIWPLRVATARSAIKASSVSPERWLMMKR